MEIGSADPGVIYIIFLLLGILEYCNFLYMGVNFISHEIMIFINLEGDDGIN